MSDPIHTAEGLEYGDVVQIAVELKDKATGNPFWWRRFACVTKVHNVWAFEALTLKMNPTTDDLRTVDLHGGLAPRQVVTTVPEDRWPQGVVAMRMKLIMQGKIQLGGD